MIDEVYSIAVVVSDRKKAADWFKGKLGFEIKEDAGEHWTVVAPPGSASGIHLCESTPLEPGNTGILLLANDFEGTVKQLKGHGVEFTRDVTKTDWGSFAQFKDPDGNVFWLMPKS